MDKKISIIVPIYKVEKYLDRCVESIVKQTYKNLEIILVDDGSPDNCPKMCDEWEKKDKRIKVIHKKNGGLSDARNAGIDVMTGEYVTFVDSDDYILPSFSKACEDLCNSNCDVMVTLANKNYGEWKYGNKNEKATIYYPISAWAKFYFISYLKANNLRFKVGIYHEDLDFNLRLLLSSPVIEKSDAEFYFYVTDNDTSITRSKDDAKVYKRISDTINIINEIQKDYSIEVSKSKYPFNLYGLLALATTISDKDISENAKKLIKENKKLFNRPLGLKNKLIWLAWNVFGINSVFRAGQRHFRKKGY